MFTTAASTIAITGGGYLAVVVMSFVSATGWRLLSGVTFDITPLRIAVYYLWHFIQPVLVGIIGAEIDLQLWSPKRFCLHVLCILLGLFVSFYLFFATLCVYIWCVCYFFLSPFDQIIFSFPT